MTIGAPTQDVFDKLLRWLDPDRDKAGEKYAKIQRRLIGIFSSRGCLEPEELADRTINVVASKIDSLIENYEGDPALFFYGVAKKVYLESLKRRIPVPPPPDPAPSDIDRVCDFLDQCLQTLHAADSTLVRRYHDGEKQEKIKNRKKLAEELKISRNALRIRVHHIHSRLRECIERLEQKNPD
jgi:hypothetical protein